MLKIKLNDTFYSIPSTWDDVTYKHFAESRAQPLEKRLSSQTQIPLEIISNLPLATVKNLIDIVEFQDRLPEFFEQVNLDIYVGNEHYVKMEDSRKALEDSDKWVAAIEITKLYTGIDISDLPVTKGMGYAVFFLDRLTPSFRSTNASLNTSQKITS